VNFAAGAVDDDGIPRIDEADRIADLADRRDTERAGDDRHMGRRPAFLEHETAQALSVVIEQRSRSHGARHDDGVFGQLLARRGVAVAE
jgi:hypothetical protein